jgi:hypothetical protein
MIKRGKKLMVAIIAAAMLSTTGISVFANSNDGWTEAINTKAASNGAWENWCQAWKGIKNNPTQMSLTPGANATQLNFAWYSKDTETNPKLKIGKNNDLSDAKELKVTSQNAVKGFISNKATATNLEENTTYYYSYEVDGKWSEAASYKTKNTKSFSFLYVGDPQIGSSNSNVATGTTEEQGQDNATRNDSFNWNNTINTALKANPNISFMLSAGDQIQTSDKKNASAAYDKNEIEYAGYLAPNALKSLPVATSIGNHDSPSANYSFHFNNPNSSDLGKTQAGGDYYYSYGNALFIMLNTNNTNIAEHSKLIEQAISENKDAKWRIVTIHHDIYGSGEHSNEPEITNLRYNLIPVFEKNNIDVVLTGHDHTYSRSLILKGGVKDESKSIKKDEFSDYVDGKTPADEKYNDYLTSIEDKTAVKDVTNEAGKTVNPDGILYMTANSASGSKYYDLVSRQQAYIAARWQEDVPTYSVVSIDDQNFTIDTYRTDNGEKIDNSYSIVKTADKKVASQTGDNVINKDSENKKTVTNVKTGDSFSTYAVVIAVLSVGGLVVVNRKGKKQQ